ncbi:hypothetical protein DEU56DRAFT_783372 [Suillus clintonianus]|uniref:uncharacterized protein n=1 Tax=Suillus clintonianus TaxID=1904413 RepID=UPI001B86D271|nr:uncharacterized protein DEU56DRAFT_783372 [Suillus clintonianus]KAG2147975.1 hypothetical protein DEU56DRAFT_783372 [Suillus clintonianus]
MMKQWARLYDKPLMTHQSVTTPQGQTLTKVNLIASFHKDEKITAARVVPSSVSPPLSPNETVPRPFRSATDRGILLKRHDLPSWTPLVASESEGSTDELPSAVEEAPPLNVRKSLSHRREAQQASNHTSGVCSESRYSRGSQSLQETLQETFCANGSYRITPLVTPIDSEGSSTDVPTVTYSRQRHRIQHTHRSTSQQGSQATAVVDTLLPNATTAVPDRASQKAAPAIRYESVQKVIDTALDTRVAKITWRRRRHTARYSTNQKSQDGTSKTKFFPFEDAVFDFDVPTSARQGDHHSEFKSWKALVEDEHRALPRKFTRIQDRDQTAILLQQSSGEKFNERLDAMFGGAERPHSPDGLTTRATADSASVFVPVREIAAGKEPSPIGAWASDSGTSVDTSLSQSTKATSVSGRNDVSRKRSYTESHLEDEPVRKKYKIQIAKDQVFKWIAALQRLVKGKTKFDHKGMEDLSVVLAEIESVYLHLDSELAPVPCLQDVLQQLSKLEDIPFRDEHDLRRRTDDIIAEWPSPKA